jgi:hypothetical protein
LRFFLVAQSCLKVFWTIGAINKHIIKLKRHVGLLARMFDASSASQDAYPKAPDAAEALARIFNTAWLREMDSDLPFEDFGPGVICASLYPSQRQAALNCIARLSWQFQHTGAALGGVPKIWNDYLIYVRATSVLNFRRFQFDERNFVWFCRSHKRQSSQKGQETYTLKIRTIGLQ